MSKNQFTGTATQPQRNRKICQFNKDQYCKHQQNARKLFRVSFVVAVLRTENWTEHAHYGVTGGGGVNVTVVGTVVVSCLQIATDASIP